MKFTCTSCGEHMDGKNAYGHEIGGCPKEMADRQAVTDACPHPEEEKCVSEHTGQIGCCLCDTWFEETA